MRDGVTRLAMVAGLLLALGLTPPLSAAPTPQQRTRLRSAEQLIKKAGGLYTAKKYKEAGEAVEQAQAMLAEVESEGDAKQLAPFTANLHKSLDKAHELLAAESSKGAKGEPGAGKISFTKQVVPLLVGKCGKCHVDQSKGEFAMASYTQLIKGSKDGIVISPGAGKTSRIVEVIESGDMPRGGGKLSAEELALLVKWIDQGAKFDGTDPGERFSSNAGAEVPRPKIDVVKASSNDEVQFARDIGPVLLANCVGCHGDRNPRGRLSLTTFSKLLNGGESGVAITPGKPEESLLVKKLRGTGGGNRMPQGKPPLPEDTIVKIEKWIAGGAKFDGPDPAAPLAEVVALVKATLATHEELASDRAELAVKNWRLVLPDSPPDRVETEHFLLYGNVGEQDLADVGRQAEEQVAKIDKLFKLSADRPFIKGKLTIYVFQKHYDYGEVGTMLERREIPTESKGHWRYSVVDAYACVVPPKHSEYAMPALLAQQIAGAFVASQGVGVPRWFAEGAGRAVTSKLDPKDARVRQWDERVVSAASGSAKPDDFITGKLNPEDSDLLAYGFVKSLMGNPAKFGAFLTGLRSGTPFDQAFAKAFGGPPNQVVMGWAPRASGRRGR